MVRAQCGHLPLSYFSQIFDHACLDPGDNYRSWHGIRCAGSRQLHSKRSLTLLTALIEPTASCSYDVVRPVPDKPHHPCFVYLRDAHGNRECVFIESEDQHHIVLDLARFTGSSAKPRIPPRDAFESAPFAVVPIPDRGLSLISLSDLSPGDHILSEPPLLLGPNVHPLSTDRFPPRSGAFENAAVSGLPDHLKHAFYTLANAHPEDGAHGIVETNAMIVPLPSSLSKPPADGEKVYSAVFPTLSRLNHSCLPNSNVFFSPDYFLGRLYGVHPIAEGEEVTITYILPEATRGERWRRLEGYGFTCGCEVCRLEGQELVDSDSRRSLLQAYLDQDEDAEDDKADFDAALSAATLERLVESRAFVHFHGALRARRRGRLGLARARAVEAVKGFRIVEGPDSVWARKADEIVRSVA